MAVYLGYNRVGIVKYTDGSIKASLKTLTGTYFFDITNAKGTEIDNLTIKGNSIQQLLPAEYQEVEYIENSGTQRIDTGLIPTNSTSVDITYQALAIHGYSQYIAGARENASASVRYAINGSSSNKYWDVRFNGVTNTITEIERTTNKYRSNLQLNNGNGTWTLTDLTTNTDYTLSISGARVPAVSNLFLFGYLNLDANTHTNLRIFACKIYEAGVLVRDFVPCYRKADNEAGMYDLVEDKFYTNAGTGSFSVASDIEATPSPEQPIEIQSVGEKTVNLFDINNVNMCAMNVSALNRKPKIENGVIYSGGAYGATEGSCIYIDTLENDGITISFDCNYDETQTSRYYRIYLFNEFDENGYILNVNRLSLTVVENKNEVSVNTAGYKYVGFVAFSNAQYGLEITNLQFELGSEVTEYEPYGYKIPISTCGENLANKNTIQENKLIGNSANGIINNSETYNTLYMEVEEGKTYKFKNFVRADGTSLRGCFYNENGAWVAAFDETTIIIPAGVKFVGRSFSKEATDVALRKVYSTKNIYLNEPLRKLGEYADILDYKNKKVIRNVWGEKPVAHDSQYFGKAFAVVTTYAVFNSDTTKRYVRCNYMQGTNAQPVASDREGKVFIGSATNYVGFGATTTFTIAGDNATATERKVFENWLENNNVLIYYVLATPTEELFECDKVILQAGTNRLEIETNVKPTESELKYWEVING